MTRTGSRAAPRFEKVSDHVYVHPAFEGGCNVGAIVGDDGVVLVDTPAERDVPSALEALARVTPKPVRWLVETQAHPEHIGGEPYFASHGVTILGSRELERLRPQGVERRGARLVFERQVRVFTGTIEVRALAVAHKARTSGDVVVIVPAERVLLTGDLFAPGRYPSIDLEAGGSASGWIEGTRQVVEAVPLLRSAMPASRAGRGEPRGGPPKGGAPKGAPAPEEKSLEEMVAVVPGHGPVATLADLKALVESAQKLRNEIVRAIGAGRSRDGVLASLALIPYREHRDFEVFAGELYDALSRK